MISARLKQYREVIGVDVKEKIIGKQTRCFNPGFRAGWLLSGLLTLLLTAPSPASAHPPSAVQPVYLEQDQALQVTITHSSFMPNYHYIEKIEIQKNSENPVVYEYSSQPDDKTFTYTYNFKAVPRKGDRINIKASCSLFGSKTVNLVVGETNGD